MVGLRWQGRIQEARGTMPPSVPPKNIFKKRGREKMVRRGKKEEREKKGSIPMSDGCSMPSFLVVGCSIRASLTCLFLKKIRTMGGDTIPSPARVLRPSFSNFNRSPTYCTITAGRRILHTIISGRRMLY